MKPRFLACLFLLMPAHGAEVTGLPAADEAFFDRLWEVAALRYEAVFADPAIEAGQRQVIALRLAESLVRQGESFKALELLEQSWLEATPARDFWKAQALAGTGRFVDAVEAFRALLSGPNFPFREESAFTCANLQLSLGKPEEALATLEEFGKSSAENPGAAIQRVAILIDLGRFSEARALLPDEALIPKKQKQFAALLHARLLFAEGKADEAASAFAALMGQPQGQSLSNYHAAALGLADALAAQDSVEAASASLLSFIQANPDSPMLEAAFKRLLGWLPDLPSSTDPVLERLAQWVTPVAVPVAGLTSNGGAAAPAWTSSPPSGDLTVFVLFTRAVGLHRVGTPAAKAEAARLLTRLLLENPGHFLTSRALLQMGRWHLEEGKTEQALHLLQVVRETAKSPLLRGEAAFLQAGDALASGDAGAAIRLFDEAAEELDAQTAVSARFNSAVIRLKSGDSTLIGQDGDTSLAENLMLERALSEPSPMEVRAAIEEFLIAHPEHPRAGEARLAVAEAALRSNPPDASFARAQLDTLKSLPDVAAQLPSGRMALAELRISELTAEPAVTIEFARETLEAHPEEAVASEALLILGQQLFQTGSYHDARLAFEKLAASEADAVRSQAAWLLAARSAALGATAQSRDEALGLFDKAMAIDASMKSIATLEKIRLMIDLNRLTEATVFLREWMGTLPENDVLRLPAGLLLGEAIYAGGSANPGTLEEALAIYDDLLVQAKDQPALLYRLQYRRGMTLENLPMKDDPTSKREAEALDAYYSVFQIAGDQPPAEWEWFENCGFRALGILENAQRWKAAIAVAKKIASFKGPRAEEAAARASQLQLKHAIWED